MAAPQSSPITSRGAKIQFTDRFVQPPGAQYVTIDDLIRVEFTSSLVPSTMRFSARVLDVKAGIVYYQQNVATSAARSPVVEVFENIEGFLLGFQCVLISGAAGGNWNYASVGFSRGSVSASRLFQVLAAGYFDLATPLFWPGGIYRWQTEGRGFMRVVTGSDPGVGASFTEPVPENARWRLVGTDITLVTDANPANRRFILEIERGAVRLTGSVSALAQTASQTVVYNVGHWGESTLNFGGRVKVNWPEHAIMSADDVLVGLATNFQAGDNFGAPVYFVEEWFERS